MDRNCRNAGQALVRIAVASTHVIALASLIVPPSLLGSVLLNPRPARAATPSLETATESFSREFNVDTARFGLVPRPRVETKAVTGRVTSLSSVAALPVQERKAPTFFWRRTRYVLTESPGNAVTVAQEDMTVAYDKPHVTIRIVSAFPKSTATASRGGELAGTEVTRTVEFDAADIESLGTSMPAQGAGGGVTNLPAGVSAESYRERVTVVSPDGAQRTYAAGEIDLATALAQGGGAGIGCVRDCFSDNGGTIGLASAICLVAGVLVCAAVCAGTVGTACFPCIAGAGTVCGVAIAAGSLTGCIVGCTWPGSAPATPTRRPPPATAIPPTPTPVPCTGDCDGNRKVTLGELQTALDTFFDDRLLGQCGAADGNRNGGVSLGEVQSAQDNFFDDCP